jgi:hypothetical protein
MTELELEEAKLIAKFMGRRGHYITDLYTFKDVGEIHDSNWYSLRNSKFHYSWDWLMAVVEMIESIKNRNHGSFGVHIVSNSCTIQSTDFRVNQMDDPPQYCNSIDGKSKFEAIHKAVIQFIEWYKTLK